MAVVKIDTMSVHLAKFLAHNMRTVYSKNHLIFSPWLLGSTEANLILNYSSYINFSTFS